MAEEIRFPLYHGTQCRAIPQILSHGLLVEDGMPVHKETHQTGEQDPDMIEKRAFDHGIYLTKTLEGALRYAFDASKDVPVEWIEMSEEFDADFDNACVLQINCLGKDARIGSDGYGDLMTDRDVPSVCIKPLYRKDVEKILNQNYEELYYNV